MGRPPQPLISHESALAAALRIIDSEGLDALSTRRLAREMNVTSAAFYHHFANKTEIITGVLGHVLQEEVEPPPAEGLNWREWIVTFATRTVVVLLNHPNLSPALAYHVPRALAPEQYEVGVRLMREGGIPPQNILPMLEASEMLMVGFVAFSTVPSGSVHNFDDVSVQRFPLLGEAVAAAPPEGIGRFETTLAAILDGWASPDSSA